MKRYCFLILFLLCLLPVVSYSQDIPDPMFPPCMVNDFAKVFTTDQRDNLEAMLLSYNDSTSTQIYVVTVNDLQGYAISDYAFKLGEKWGIGQKEKNNGAVVLIKPKRENSRGDVFIAVGYGLEPYLNDARIGRILDNYMIPYLRQDDYYRGTSTTVTAMMQYLSGQFQADPKESSEPLKSIIIGIILIVLFIYFMNKIGGSNNNNTGGGNNNDRSNRPIFFPPMGGGGFGGGFGGGGFGGGGGGSFGGGGAGRSW